ncbi:structural maintenance of chromosomes protein 6 [Anabrus simplex]|uniref:structural maintenance of chromosomes protein 6 n=1 Tax=Anabrus simplex TaxID=316456 RepID=UPI0035A33B09
MTMTGANKRKSEDDDSRQKVKQIRLTANGDNDDDRYHNDMDLDLDDEDDSEELERLLPSLYIRPSHEKHSGFIEKLRLKNFMCHSSLEITLNQNINFIVGRNGSGKSAILSAIVVGLGGKALTTNRAAALKDFIKKGAASATIEITLSNCGFAPFRRERYGDKIIVSRTINSSGQTSYKIKCASGEVLTSRKDMDMVINGLRIQVDNPVSILNQEAARTFLMDTNPYIKYLLFMKATRMDKVMESFKEIKEVERNSYAVYKSRKEVLVNNKKELDELADRLSVLESLQLTRNTIVNLENELYWAIAVCEQKKLDYVQKELDNETALIPQKKEEIEKCIQQEAELNDKLRDVSTEVRELQQALKKMSAVREDAMRSYRADEFEYSSKLAALEEWKRRVHQKNSDINTLQAELEKDQRSGPEREMERKSQIQKVRKIDDEIKKISSTESTTTTHSNNLKSTIGHYEEELRSHRSQLLEIKRSIDDRVRRIKQLQSESHSLSVFGSWMPRLNEMIDNADRQRKFHRRPVGPIGAHLKVRDSKWSATVESFISRPLLFSFCCHDRHDAEVLKRLISSIPNENQHPGTITSKFLDRVHDVSQNLVRHPEYPSLYDILDISHPAVANILIDKLEIESILLIPSNQEACNIMSDRRNVPRKCKRAITLQGDMYYPDPDYRTYAGEGKKKTQYLQVSTEQMTRDLMEDRDNLIARATNLEQEVSQIQRKIVDERRSLKETEERIRVLWNEKRVLMNEKNKILDTLPPEPTDRETLGQELEAAQIDLENSLQQVKILEKQVGDLLQTAQNSKKQASTLDSEVKKLKEKINELQGEARNIDESVKDVNTKIKGLQNALSVHEEKVKHIQCSRDQQQQKTSTAVQCARDLCPEIKTKRFPSDIREELNRLKEQVKTVENERGTLDAVADEYYTKKQTYNSLCTKMDALNICLRALLNAIDLRKSSYMRIIKLMAFRIKCTYIRILGQRNYEGSMEFDHHDKLLVVYSNPINGDQKSTRDTKTLSGGERSYSTVAFVLSLWEAVEPPFFIMDEFDVFMDKVNRGIVIELLLAHARGHPHFQYLFITPQDTSSVKAAEDLNIIQMGTAE